MHRSAGILSMAFVSVLTAPGRADEDSSSDRDWLVHVTRSLPAERHVHIDRE
jgi:hypothetical protein